MDRVVVGCLAILFHKNTLLVHTLECWSCFSTSCWGPFSSLWCWMSETGSKGFFDHCSSVCFGKFWFRFQLVAVSVESEFSECQISACIACCRTLPPLLSGLGSLVRTGLSVFRLLPHLNRIMDEMLCHRSLNESVRAPFSKALGRRIHC
jgi:hypothetical protein